jgi:hypothetical protein
MNVVNQRKDSSVHHHQLNQSHVLTFVSLKVLTIEDFNKRNHHNINLDIIKSVCGQLVLVLEVFAVFHQGVWQGQKIN